MKISLPLVLVLTVVCRGGILAQSVVITGQEVTYSRPKAERDYKKTFTINYPKVKASTRSLSRNIEKAISYESLFSYFNLKEELKQSEWVDSADYEVLYNKNGLLCISLSLEGSGAYPSGDTKYIVVNLKNGIRVKPSDVFDNLQGLLKMVRKAKDREVSKATTELKKDPENSEIDQVFSGSPPLRLDQFSISDKGVTFHYNYEFMHVIEALQPPGEFMFTWKQLKPYIRAGSLLSRAAR